MTRASSEPQRIVLYDNDCAFCKWSLDKVLAWDRRRRLRPVAIQSDEGQGLLADVPESERLDSWHLVLPSGEVRSAGAAAAPLAESAPGGPTAGLPAPGLTWRHRPSVPPGRREPQPLRALARYRRELRASAVAPAGGEPRRSPPSSRAWTWDFHPGVMEAGWRRSSPRCLSLPGCWWVAVRRSRTEVAIGAGLSQVFGIESTCPRALPYAWARRSSRCRAGATTTIG